FVKADERIGIVEFAPIDFTKQGFDTRAACAEVALRFIEFAKQLIERFSGHSFWFLVPGFWFLVGVCHCATRSVCILRTTRNQKPGTRNHQMRYRRRTISSAAVDARQ